jgi:hypothetical protein
LDIVNINWDNIFLTQFNILPNLFKISVIALLEKATKIQIRDAMAALF